MTFTWSHNTEVSSTKQIKHLSDLQIVPKNTLSIEYCSMKICDILHDWCHHLRNSKNVKNTDGGMSLLVKLQGNIPPWVFFTFLKLYKWYQIAQCITISMRISSKNTALKMKFSIKDFFSACDQIRGFLQIWPHLLKKYLTLIRVGGGGEA